MLWRYSQIARDQTRGEREEKGKPGEIEHRGLVVVNAHDHDRRPCPSGTKASQGSITECIRCDVLSATGDRVDSSPSALFFPFSFHTLSFFPRVPHFGQRLGRVTRRHGEESSAAIHDAAPP